MARVKVDRALVSPEMTFHAVSLEMTGDVRETRPLTIGEVVQHEAGAMLVDWFAGHLRVRESELRLQGRISTSILNGRGVMCFTQINPSTAFVRWNLEGRLAAYCLLFSGADPKDDREALGTVQTWITQLLAGSQWEPGFDLIQIRERPVVVWTPWPDASEADQHTTSNLSVWLAAAFFSRFENRRVHVGRE